MSEDVRYIPLAKPRFSVVGTLLENREMNAVRGVTFFRPTEGDGPLWQQAVDEVFDADEVGVLVLWLMRHWSGMLLGFEVQAHYTIDESAFPIRLKSPPEGALFMSLNRTAEGASLPFGVVAYLRQPESVGVGLGEEAH